MLLAGRCYYPVALDVPLPSFLLALLFTTVSLSSLGFPLASVVPTAHFAQPIGSLVLYPMMAVSGLFMPIDALPPPLQGLARLLPFTYAVSLLRGVWNGEGWSAHLADVAVLMLMSVAFTTMSIRLFRWE